MLDAYSVTSNTVSSELDTSSVVSATMAPLLRRDVVQGLAWFADPVDDLDQIYHHEIDSAPCIGSTQSSGLQQPICKNGQIVTG
jgi:hypothetical protein